MRLAFSGWHIVVSIVSGLVAAWLILVLVLALARPNGTRLKEALRLMPDVLRLVRRLAADPSLTSGVRLRLGLLLAYLVFPIDLVPDFIPVLGYADDAILVCLVLRSVVRKAGSDAVRRNWPGTPDGLTVLWRAAGLPGSPDSN